MKATKRFVPIRGRLAAAVVCLTATAAATLLMFGGQAMAATRPDGVAAPGPSAVPPLLGFVKYSHSGSGTVEVHVDAYRNGSYQRALDTVSDFSPVDAHNGAWSLFGDVNGAPELGFVKYSHSGSGRVEVHVDVYRGGSYQRVLDTVSDFSPVDAHNGAWSLFGDVNGAPELGFVKYSHSGSGRVEVHVDVYRGGSYHRVLDTVSDFNPIDAYNGAWSLFGGANGAPELGFVKYSHVASGMVEVHVDVYRGGSYQRVLDGVSDFSPAEAYNGAWSLFGGVNGAPELGFVKYSHSGSGRVEVHVDVRRGRSYRRVMDTVSDFSPVDAHNGAWSLLTAS